MDVYLSGKRIRLDPAKSIGKGGEADVYDIGGGKALKVFKPPSHPDYQDAPHEQTAARERIAEHQHKLPAFPQGLPSRVITPQELATSRFGGEILGYSMMFLEGAEVLLRYAEKNFRQSGVDSNTVVSIFRDLHTTVNALHKAQVVMGDFNDLNVLVKGTEAYLIDADSFQFGKFLCRVFTGKFVDPLRCDPRQSPLLLKQPHTADSDWYAYAVMLMQCLLFVGPFGGVFRPKDPLDRVPHDARPLHRITVFHPEVQYPKPAVPLDRLPDELLERFREVFVEDQRGEFPAQLLEKLRWTRCIKCGTEHARRVCPVCAQGVRMPVVTVRGRVRATYPFRTEGVILFATIQGGVLRWVYHENEQFKREDGRVVLHGGLDPHIRCRIRGSQTLLGKDATVFTLQDGQQPERLNVDRFGLVPIFDANERYRYWIESGRLLRDGQLGSEFIGDVLAGQTLFWVGEKFGFGFYRAADLSVAFVFDAERRGINDNVKLSTIRGQVVDATCRFTKDRCWFFIATREGGRTVNRCMVILSGGNIEAEASAVDGDGSWLGSLRAKCAVGNFLLAATDDGLVRVEPDAKQIVETKRFPDAEPFVDAGCHLFPGKEGLYVVDPHEIRLLQMS
jgi:tRNA A-37 threonylcarbamoyl transferase component Bud32